MGGAVGTVNTALTQTRNLSLDVTPIVSNDGSISLETNLLQETPGATVAGGLSKNTRNIRTQIILQDGDTAVLGGVFEGTEKNGNSGVPFLRKLPLLGQLFSQQTVESNNTEVLIFITARVLNPDTAFKRKL